ncbi:YncE family protein [Flexivirga meconopsidis]|uniref:YncE family protein n=1 Tax=Flexivirga meconopsidis TaxID=2977121 RepID=UPI00223FD594|nr:YncE family protein [Flexivirga meconopsidis]
MKTRLRSRFRAIVVGVTASAAIATSAVVATPAAHAAPDAPKAPAVQQAAAQRTAGPQAASQQPATGRPQPTSHKQSVSSLAASPNAASVEGLIYVPITDENAVWAINPSTRTVVAKIANVGMHPIVLRATPDHRKIYVDNFGPLQGQVTVIDTATNTITKKIATLGPAYASEAMSPDGKFLLVPTAFSVVQKIDTATDKIVATFPIAFLPIDIEITPDTQSFYAFATYGTVASYSSATGRKIKPSISVKGLAPGWAVLSKDGKTLYSINFLNSNIAIIDTEQWRVTRTVQLPQGSWPLSATLTQDESELWVADIGFGKDTYNLTIIDPATATVKQVLRTPTAPAYVGFSPDGKHAYVSDLGPVSNLPPVLRPLFYDIFYLLPPGQTGYIDDYDVQTKQLLGRTETGTGPVAGVYF